MPSLAVVDVQRLSFPFFLPFRIRVTSITSNVSQLLRNFPCNCYPRRGSEVKVTKAKDCTPQKLDACREQVQKDKTSEAISRQHLARLRMKSKKKKNHKKRVKRSRAAVLENFHSHFDFCLSSFSFFCCLSVLYLWFLPLVASFLFFVFVFFFLFDKPEWALCSVRVFNQRGRVVGKYKVPWLHGMASLLRVTRDIREERNATASKSWSSTFLEEAYADAPLVSFYDFWRGPFIVFGTRFEPAWNGDNFFPFCLFRGRGMPKFVE